MRALKKMGYALCFGFMTVSCAQSSYFEAPVANNQDACRHVKSSKSGYNDYDDAELITASGNHCLIGDLVSKPKFTFQWEGHPKTPRYMLAFASGGGVLNLNGHSVLGETPGTDGIKNIRPGVANIAIRNGRVVSATGSGIDLGGTVGLPGRIVMDYYNGYLDISSLKGGDLFDFKRDAHLLGGVGDRLKFPAKNVQIDSVVVVAGQGSNIAAGEDRFVNGIVLGGAGNVIRNSVIEVYSANGAITLFGPNQLIENNRIVFKGRAAYPNSAPIKLTLGDSSIIRNNTIVIEGAEGSPKSAISLTDSRNVIIENNKIEGVGAIYKAWDEYPGQRSSVQSKTNQLKAGRE
jgi:hypothetical protein